MLETGLEVSAHLADILEHVVLLEDVQGCHAGRGQQRVAAVGAGVVEVVAFEHVCHGLADDHGAEGQAAAERLRDDDQVRLDGVVLEGEPVAGSAQAGLCLVGDEDHAEVVGELAHLLDPLLRRYDHPRRAEEELGQERGRLAGGGPLDLEPCLAGAGQTARPAAAELAAVLVGYRDLDHAGRARPVPTPAKSRRRGHEERSTGQAVVAAQD